MYEEVSLPAELFPKLENGGSYRIVILAQQHGLLLGEAQERVSIGAASSEAVRLVVSTRPMMGLSSVPQSLLKRLTKP
jgi:hypothetical protein